MSEFPIPDPDFEPTRPFFEGAARGELVIPRCSQCDRFQWTPPERCRSCGGGELAWVATSGRGTLFSFAIVRRPLLRQFAPLVPYAAGIVTLEEDPSLRLVTRFVDCDPDGLRIGQPLRAVFRPLGHPSADWELVVPFFTPAG
jgi:uncharacterized OB-fold protein